MLAALNTSQRKLLGGLRGVRRSPHQARVENLSPLRRGSVVSARVYAGDCEANVEKERIGWGVVENHSAPWPGKPRRAHTLPVDPHVVTCKHHHHPLGYHPRNGREGDEMRIPELPPTPQKEKGKNRCLSFRRIVMLTGYLYQQ